MWSVDVLHPQIWLTFTRVLYYIIIQCRTCTGSSFTDDQTKIEEAQRLKREADERARTSKMIKRLTQAIQGRDLNELEETLQDAKKKKVTAGKGTSIFFQSCYLT